MTVGVVSETLDLSRLPAPTIVEALSFEEVLTAMVTEVQRRLPSFDATLDSDPAMMVLQAAALREFLLRQDFNDRARGLMLAYATGSNLDQLGALMGVQRITLTPANTLTGEPAVMEDDEALRQRIVLAPESYSVAGPELAYVFHARSAHPEVLDASCVSPNPGEVVITVLARGSSGVATSQVLDAVEARVNSREVRPLTDFVTVQSVNPVPFQIDAQIFTFHGPDANTVLDAAKAKLAKYLADNRKIGRDITFSGLNAALTVDGVQRVTFSTPRDTVAVGPTQVAQCTASNVTFGGYDS